jgi:hypothetical protein
MTSSRVSPVDTHGKRRLARGLKIRAWQNRFALDLFALRHSSKTLTVESMKKLLSAVFVVALSAGAMLAQESARIAGSWQMSMDSPHGLLKGPLKIEQDGSKLTATYEVESIGTLRFSGTVEGNKVSFEIPGGEMTLKLKGIVDGDKMSGTTSMNDGAWTATRPGQASKTILGTVAEFKAHSAEIGLKPDTGEAVFFKVGMDTQVVRIPPGEQDLEKAKPAQVTDLALGDRVLVSFVAGLSEARRIVLIPATDIARRNEAERLDWEKRGISGVVAANNGNQIALEMRTPLGAHTVTITVTGKTIIRRYAPDSVSFAAAEPSNLAAIAKGDQLRTRGQKSEDGATVIAENIVFGTFLTRLGPITAVDREAREIRIQDAATKKLLTIRLTPESQIKMLPDFHKVGAPTGDGTHGAPLDIAKMLQQLPGGAIEDLKVGGMVLVTSTRSASSDKATAIMLLANADTLVQVAQAQAAGADPLDAIGKMHGGMLGGTGGLSLPAMIP